MNLISVIKNIAKRGSPQNLLYRKVFLWLYFLLLVAVHILFFVFTKCYFISSGVILIIGISIFLYYLIFLTSRLLRKNINKQNLFLVTISVALVLVVLELSFIFTGYKSTYLEKRYKLYYASHYAAEDKNWFHVWHRNHYLESSEYRYYRSINSLGLSDIEHPVEKDSSEYRIIALGDSFTEGDGADADSTWLKFLERGLQKYNYPLHLRFMNAGVCGSDPYFEYILLREKLLQYKPDLVIVCINSTDILDVMLRGDMARFQPDGSVKYNHAPWFEPIYASSHLSRIVFEALGYDEFLTGDRNSGDLSTRTEKQIIQCLYDFKKLADENGFRLLVAFQPLSWEVVNNSSSLQKVINATKQAHIDYCDLMEYYTVVEKMDSATVLNYFWSKDGHHNSTGYGAFGRGIEKHILLIELFSK